jgi:hypothetical protein
VILPFLLLAIWPGTAAAKDKDDAKDMNERDPLPCTRLAAGQACLYEVAEQVVFFQADGTTPATDLSNAAFRYATSSLMGTTGPGGTLCPMFVPCSIVAQGSSLVDLSSGEGTFEGQFAVVVNEPGTIEAPKVVICVGAFSGAIDLSPTLLSRLTNGAAGAPLGFLGRPTPGKWSLGVGWTPGSGSLTGTFRLPFTSEGVVLKDLEEDKFSPSRGGVDPAFYLLDDGRSVRIRPVERSLGNPTVRLEATFK